MAYAIRRFDGAVAILGYADAEPWVVVTKASYNNGLVGPPERPIAWIMPDVEDWSSKARVLLLDVVGRRIIGKIKFPDEPDCKPVLTTDGKYLVWALATDKGCLVKAVDTSTGASLDYVFEDKEPVKDATWRRHVLTTLAGGRLRVLTKDTTDYDLFALTIDLATGRFDQKKLPNKVVSFSPSGKYMLLETRARGDIERTKKEIRRLFSLDLWQCEPPRKIGRLPCMSMTARPDADDDIDDSVVTDDFGCEVFWQKDETAFWVLKQGFMACVGLDGTRTPAMRSERQNFDDSGSTPLADEPHIIEALDGRRAKLTIYDTTSGGYNIDVDSPHEVEVDGAPSQKLLEPLVISAATDRGRLIKPIVTDKAFDAHVQSLVAKRPIKMPKTTPAIYVGRCPTPVSLSRIGGLPHLPKEIVWPKNPNTGRSLHFLAQIDLTAIPQTPLQGAKAFLPTSGLLLFFADMEYELLFADYGAHATTRVVYVPTAAGSERQLPGDLPPLSYDPKTLRHWQDAKSTTKTWPVSPLEACVIEQAKFGGEIDADALLELGLKNAAAIEKQTGRALPVLKETSWELPAYYLEQTDAGAGKQPRLGVVLGHQLLGSAHPVQCAFEEAKASGRIALLQLRDDKGIDLSGLIQFWIKPAELAAQKFEKAFATYEH